MKKPLSRVVMTHLRAVASVLLVAAGMLGVQSASAAGIADTKHNLGSGGTGVNKFSGTGEICVFCHTPHGADTSASVPLWNRVLGAPASYTTYNSLGTSSLDGATAPVGSVSLACLSCHDGTQAMNVMINQPGSGKIDATFAAGTWSGANQTAGAIKAGLITEIGVDLKNDHPIGIQYGGGPASGEATLATYAFKDTDFNATSSATINTQPVWWVDTTTGGSSARQKTDMQLYTRTSGLTNPQPFVECASCHDPHTSANPTFLRISNTGSAVCLACHIK